MGADIPGPVPALPGREPMVAAERQELARVDADLLDDLLNNAGEVSIFRARVEQQMTSVEFNLAELERTVTRLREQLRKLELETEAMILHRHQDDAQHRADFDPLELDRYSTIQQLSRALAESVSDVASIEGLLGNLTREGQNLLLQQGRIVTELQNGLMKTRMVPFQRHVQRLTRLVRQTAQETGKKVELEVEGGSGELDRQVLERMLPPFEHMLRNSVVHGIELPADRLARGKPETGTIAVRLQREGAEVVILVEDDGAGLDVAAIRGKARSLGLLRPEQTITDEETLQLILEPGFSTAERLTQQAGRGVGMDVVATEVKKLGGGLFIESNPGRGARFTIRLPFTLAITQALIVRVHDEHYALPVATVEGVARLPRSEITQHLTEEVPSFEYGGQVYRFQYLGTFMGSGPSMLPENDLAVPVILVRAGEHSAALVTDELVGSREIVVKSLGPQIAGIRGIAGATILGDGRIVVILDMGALVRSEWRSRPVDEAVRPSRDDRIFAAGGRRLDHRAARHPAPARAQRHAGDDREGRRRCNVAAAGTRPRRAAARHRDAADGRLRGRVARPQRPAARRRADHHDHLARGRQAPRPRDRARRGRLPGQALPGEPAARCDRAAGARPSPAGRIEEAP